MKLYEIIEPCGLSLITGDISREVHGIYSCDLLSHAALNLNKGDIWITVINNINTVAAAAFSNAACAVIAEGIEIPDALIKRAEERGVTLLSYPGRGTDLIINIYKIFHENTECEI